MTLLPAADAVQQMMSLASIASQANRLTSLSKATWSGHKNWPDAFLSASSTKCFIALAFGWGRPWRSRASRST